MKKIVKTLLVLLFSCTLTVYVMLAKPYIEGKYVRLSDTPADIFTSYNNVTGAPLCTKFYEVIDGKLTDYGVFPNLAKDLPDPHKFNVGLKEGDIVIFTGYLYQWQEMNLLTKEKSVRKVNLMDVIAWNVLEGKNYQTEITNHQASQFKGNNYISCR